MVVSPPDSPARVRPHAGRAGTGVAERGHEGATGANVIRADMIRVSDTGAGGRSRERG